MNETITLTMTRDHAQVVQDACELLVRLKLGQTSYPTELMLGWPNYEDNGMNMTEYCKRRDIANDILRAFLKAVGNPEGTPKDDVENMAYEVFGTIRHALFMHDYPDNDGWSVASREPLSESGRTMPKCEVR